VAPGSGATVTSSTARASPRRIGRRAGHARHLAAGIGGDRDHRAGQPSSRRSSDAEPLGAPPRHRSRRASRSSSGARDATQTGWTGPRKADIPGASVAIIFPDGSTWLGTSGLGYVQGKRTVTPDTVVRESPAAARRSLAR
jgi:hypothetical protein